MPANFTAVNSEVVYGGADLFSILADTTAPVWNAANVKQFNTNVITLVSNSFFQKAVNSTLGVMFSGNWGVKENDKKTANGFIFGKDNALWNALDNNGHDTKMSGLNKFMQGVGALAAVYQLGTSTAKAAVAESKPIGVTGTLSF